MLDDLGKPKTRILSEFYVRDQSLARLFQNQGPGIPVAEEISEAVSSRSEL